MSAAAVSIEGLRCVAARRVLLQLERLEIAHGERIVIVGPNGAGKSTLLRCLSGFARPTQGRVRVLGRDLAPRALQRSALRGLRAELGQVLQGVHLVPRLSALDNTLIGALGRLRGAAAWRSCWGRFPDAEIAAARQALADVGLNGREDLRVDSLSGGERQKVAVARLLLQRPRLVLADEPTASLDPAAARSACMLLSQAAASATLISVVHEPALVPLLGSRVLGLRAGRIVFDGRADALDEGMLVRLYAP